MGELPGRHIGENAAQGAVEVTGQVHSNSPATAPARLSEGKAAPFGALSRRGARGAVRVRDAVCEVRRAGRGAGVRRSLPRLPHSARGPAHLIQDLPAPPELRRRLRRPGPWGRARPAEARVGRCAPECEFHAPPGRRADCVRPVCRETVGVAAWLTAPPSFFPPSR
ncbi:hypothetical protein GCM10027168_27930 [Streptomyces capparidis]